MAFPPDIRVFAPATVANVGPGFDCLGLTLEGVGDELVFKAVHQPGIHLLCPNSDLSTELEKNVVGMAVKKIWNNEPRDFGVEITIHKGIVPGSGIGSSAASAAAAAGGISHFLGLDLTREQLLSAGMDGEYVASKFRHADNVAPALFGGITLIRSTEECDVKQLPVPSELHVAVIRPDIEIKTADARLAIPHKITVSDATSQAAHLAGFVASLYEEDYDLMKRSLRDFLAEPYRKSLIPGFDEVREEALRVGAIGFGISGSGPSMFALCRKMESAKAVAEAMARKMRNQSGIESIVYHSKVNDKGFKVLNQ